jgi:CNT family concentrative nucleoside transporter
MISPDPSAAPAATSATAPEPIPQPTKQFAPMPLSWRVGLLVAVAALGGLAYVTHGTLGPRGQAGFGILCFLGLAAACSRNLRAVSLKTFGWGVALQAVLALAVTQSEWVRAGFEWVGKGVGVVAACSDKGAEFVFGKLADPGGPTGFVFAFRVLPPILFISALFSVLYHFGVLQFLVKLFARVMMYFLGSSGAETLSVAANVFMGQTEAPLIVKPFVPRMTASELLTLMASGMAHVSGALLVVYVGYGADPASILCTCVMACPCSIYLSKLVLPELAHPVTAGDVAITVEKTSVNPIDAAATGIKDGLFLALNVAAMLIGFIAFIALFDAILGGIKPGLTSLGVPAERLDWWPDGLNLEWVFGKLFAPLAFLIGVPADESNQVGTLLGIKLAANEHVAFIKFKSWTVDLEKLGQPAQLSDRARKLATYALTGFANFASIGIQLGGIGAMAPERRKDLARLGLTALFVGFLVTLINAAVAGLLLGTN